MAWAWLSVWGPRQNGKNVGPGVGRTQAGGPPGLLAVASGSFLRRPPPAPFLP